MIHTHSHKKIIIISILTIFKCVQAHNPFVWVSIVDDNKNLWNLSTSYSCKDLYLHALSSFAYVMKDEDKAEIYAILLYDGNDGEFIKKAKSLYNLTVINTKFSLASSTEFIKKDKAWQSAARSTYMRLDAAEHIRNLGLNCSHALVTDVDIIFLKDPRKYLAILAPEKFSACPEDPLPQYHIFDLDKNYFNNGIVWINVDFMYKMLPALRNFILSKEFNIPGAYDQGALNQFMRKTYNNYQLEQLPLTLNWKAYWGTNPEAIIVHFPGPKPDHFAKYLRWHYSEQNTNSISDEKAATILFPSPVGLIFIKLLHMSSPEQLQYMVDLFKNYDSTNVKKI